jgi:hypothetical protein
METTSLFACSVPNERSEWAVNYYDFANLFSEALNDQPLDRLPPEAKGGFLARFEHKVSDHMPLWLRLPRP